MCLHIAPRINYMTAPNITTYNKNPFEVPMRYMPGISYKFISTNDGIAWLALGLDFKVFWNIWRTK